MNSWILANDKLPKNGQPVLCWYEYVAYNYDGVPKIEKDYGIGRYYYGAWVGEVSNGVRTKVLFWQPLPEPPSGCDYDG